MKNFVIAISFSILLSVAHGQTVIDSLEKQLSLSKPDTNRVIILSELALNCAQSNSALALKYAQEGLALARALKFRRGIADCLRRSGIALYQQGRYPEAMDVFQRSLRISEETNYLFGIATAWGHIANLNMEQGDYIRARLDYFKYLEIAETEHNNFEQANALEGIGRWYIEQNYLDSALLAYQRAFTLIDTSKSFIIAAAVWRDLGELETKKGNDKQAMMYFRKSIPYGDSGNYYPILNTAYLGIARLFLREGNRDSCVFYAKLALQAGQNNSYAKGIVDASELLSQVYESNDEHEAFKYQKIATAFKDSLFNTQRSIQVQNLLFDESQRQQMLEAERINFRNQLRLYALLSALGVFLLLAVILYRNYKKTRLANDLLRQQKEEIHAQRAKAENALEELKATQAQLIQSEKMASLGELTAGIAHEIQNPLNFVTNFSEVSRELIDELKNQKSKLKSEEQDEILDDIDANLEKINHHGNRADSIVKGMLQHSRKSEGKKELTDIKKLADEFLRLAYHGLRAKDKSFNAELKTNFDESLEKINIVPQDIGRVLLNIFNNAFYAVNEKRKLSANGYQPIAKVTTRKLNDKIEISVEDNGNGIPQNIIDKIFHPFFTTKPTGQGTGLGLSLAYDIIKAHGGEIRVKSTEGEGSEFIVQLPI
jgi:two-component system NtrC family sensor kinase